MRTPFDICVVLNHPKTVFSRLGGLSEFSAITLFLSLGAFPFLVCCVGAWRFHNSPAVVPLLTHYLFTNK
jgi:hypothetical protein